VNKGELVVKAEQEISAILAKLEQDLGMAVDSIELQTIDVSSINSKEYVKRVVIEMHKQSMAHW
jgi:hypothetical protein